MRHFLSLICTLLLASFAFAGGDDSSPASAIEHTPNKPEAQASQPGGRFAIGLNTSLLGPGAEVATRVTHNSNVRAGFNILGYSHSIDKDGATYNAHLGFRSVQAHYDFFPWASHGFHVSPGMLAFIGNPLSASAVLSSAQTITLGGTDYTSDPNQPATLKGTMKFRQVSPMLTVGFGNLVRHDRKHFTVPFEIGVGFTGSPSINLTGSGNLCDASGSCQSTSSGSVQQHIIAEQNKLDRSLRVMKVFPIISTGFAYKF